MIAIMRRLRDENVVNVDEVADVRTAKIHADRYARIRTGARVVGT